MANPDSIPLMEMQGNALHATRHEVQQKAAENAKFWIEEGKELTMATHFATIAPCGAFLLS
jgi:hypothetical protein